ncbi:hypothetical protein D0U02_27375 [Burkholderia pseudomallei]|uniref:Lipoprotein n=1 Tax=Burkholderia pseudomallei TaxID=28450 RepID=A0AAX0UIM2_BURPE|nr:hypothetical protein BOC35_33090 [Burkholderia pseudomallei]EDK60503.1 hypothetical protein BMAJHU_C0583 [Burkholderia mallei JHU]EDK85755.1 hypothetical protein BMA721280_A0392 [Burkholderia mallei 2002721280]EDP88689.1 hypothetical protein BMA10399_E0980 [Burkholderia mallei ATCC 10399]EEP85259.1 hypothetical protein BMAGB8_1087 [Burkholderia mallei GB8 horse 4]EES45343.1 hypothetical protein BMAPRL20_A1005 [Burkholderia mallei PRL-20]PNX06390.1 hypothetical protein CF649_04300 [Burkhold
MGCGAAQGEDGGKSGMTNGRQAHVSSLSGKAAARGRVKESGFASSLARMQERFGARYLYVSANTAVALAAPPVTVADVAI